ncbi:hypothetical protein R7070_04575 [Vibrio sp. 1557]|uniref:hypothetical protein n=1 Tax=Vibrio sp. 1557 TaxID=3074561 RepID=UPI002965622B|nr:hypothetical protein [Vibrio sp. 1557]MDW2262021.1 hypothetical protein [Vibrio sp. 1557]
MKVTPMIFNTEMVKALLSGRKTVTRRPIKRIGEFNFVVENGQTKERYVTDENNPHQKWLKFPINIDDLIYVRETFRIFNHSDECGCSEHCYCPPTGTPIYFATHDDGESKWNPSIHMPRWASRLTLRVTDVRIERVKEITDEQARAEGCWYGVGGGEVDLAVPPQDHFPTLWDSIYQNWDENPYVWVIEFEAIHQNVDKVVSEMGDVCQ